MFNAHLLKKKGFKAIFPNASESSLYQHYIARWDKEHSQMVRMGDAADITTSVTNFKHSGTVNANYSNPFDNIYPWSARRLCNISIEAYRALAPGEPITHCVEYWEGDEGFSYSHANGVWVYTPAFRGRSWDDGTYRYYEVTNDPLTEATLYPPQITGRWLGCNVTLAIDGTDKRCNLPTLGMQLKNIAVSTQHTYAKNYGGSIRDIYSLDASTLLYLVEYANWNIQNSIGDGVSDLYQQSLRLASDVTDSNTITMSAANAKFIEGAVIDIGTSNGGYNIARTYITAVDGATLTLADAVTATTSHYVSIHGRINMADEEIGSKSGYIGTNGRADAYYRGEVLYGNMWRYILGAYRETGTGAIWTADRADTNNYDALNTSVHHDTGLALPTSSGYVKSLGMAEGLCAPPFCTEIGGDDTNPVGDYCYVPALTTGNTVLLFGGSANNGARDGFYGNWSYAASYSYWNTGSSPRLINP